MKLEFRARCPKCKTVRILVGPWEIASEAELDLMELSIPEESLAVCPVCNAVEDIAMFVDDAQAEPWENADEAERKHGRKAGPLPRKPWPDTN